MKTHEDICQHLVLCLCIAAVLLLQATDSFAQLPPEVAKYGYADTIFFNGKVVSMDDKSASTGVGNIYQAIAVKGHKIVKLGISGEVRALAGPDTKVLDLQGRTLIPGIIEPHMHIYGEVVRYLDRLGFKYPPQGIIVETQAKKTLEETQNHLRETVQEAVKQVEPGDWVVVRMQAHPEAPRALGLWGSTRRLTNRKTLDLWARPITRFSCAREVEGISIPRPWKFWMTFCQDIRPPSMPPCTEIGLVRTSPPSAG